MKETIIIGLGSSVGDKKYFLDQACKEIQKLGTNIQVSTYVESKPLGGVAKNSFLNAVCSFETNLIPHALLDELQIIESKYGRIRLKVWDDRTLDLDILYYGDRKVNDGRLIIPHKEIKNRDFVMGPILELFPNFKF